MSVYSLILELLINNLTFYLLIVFNFLIWRISDVSFFLFLFKWIVHSLFQLLETPFDPWRAISLDSPPVNGWPVLHLLEMEGLLRIRFYRFNRCLHGLWRQCLPDTVFHFLLCNDDSTRRESNLETELLIINDLKSQVFPKYYPVCYRCGMW